MARPKAMHTACAALVLAACLLGCASPARAHGYLKQPASRNYRASLLPHGTDREYCPHCLGSRDDNMPVCGFDRYMSPQPVTDTYTEGQVIDVTITATVVHLGRFELRLCPRPDSPNWQCFDMPQHALTRADNVRYGSKYWYFESAGDGSNGGAQSYGVGDFSLRFKLPDGVTCEHCTMQFFWQAGNDCAPTPCNDDPRYRPGQPCGAGYSHRRTCSSRFDSELFLNCADVRIVPRSGGPTPQPTPGPTPQPTPAPLPSSGGPVTDPWGQCGAGMATCPSGYCCSEWGWCGSSSDHCSSGCQSAYGSCWGGPTPTPTPTPTPQPAPQPRWTDPCTKCNLPGDQGGCKCDSNCACVVVDDGNPCTKCNLPEDQGGCKCDSNCACAADFANPCTKCNLPVSEGGCKCDSNCDCRP